jgi:hypothetical protein
MKYQSFPSAMHTDLNHYVYVYVDTSAAVEKVIYVGKGVGNRCFAHLKTSTEDPKSTTIRGLHSRDHLRIDLLAWGLDSATALKVEAAAIDLLGLDTVLNRQSGHHSAEIGRVIVDDLIARKTRSQVTRFEHDCLLIRVNQRYHVGMSPLELYEATRGVWKVGPAREQVQYALAVYQGIVQEVYQVGAWLQGGSTYYDTRVIAPDEVRWEFVGTVAEPDVRNTYRYHSVEDFFPTGAQNPVTYAGPSFK